MAGSRAKPSRILCDNCKVPAVEIWFIGNHGEKELLEVHCNRCGFSLDGETMEIRNPGRIYPTIEKPTIFRTKEG